MHNHSLTFVTYTCPCVVVVVVVGSIRDATGSWNQSFILCGLLLMASAMLNILGPYCWPKARKQLQLSDNKIDWSPSHRVVPLLLIMEHLQDNVCRPECGDENKLIL